MGSGARWIEGKALKQTRGGSSQQVNTEREVAGDGKEF